MNIPGKFFKMGISHLVAKNYTCNIFFKRQRRYFLLYKSLNYCGDDTLINDFYYMWNYYGIRYD